VEESVFSATLAVAAATAGGVQTSRQSFSMLPPPQSPIMGPQSAPRGVSPPSVLSLPSNPFFLDDCMASGECKCKCKCAVVLAAAVRAHTTDTAPRPPAAALSHR
jgi:hypothetical protein